MKKLLFAAMLICMSLAGCKKNGDDGAPVADLSGKIKSRIMYDDMAGTNVVTQEEWTYYESGKENGYSIKNFVLKTIHTLEYYNYGPGELTFLERYYNFDTGSLLASHKCKTVYADANYTRPASEIRYSNETGSSVESHTDYTYDQSGRLTDIKIYSGQTTVVEHDRNFAYTAKRMECVYDIYDGAEVSGSHKVVLDYADDDMTRPLTETIYTDEQGTGEMSLNEWGYDSQGRLTSMKTSESIEGALTLVEEYKNFTYTEKSITYFFYSGADVQKIVVQYY